MMKRLVALLALATVGSCDLFTDPDPQQLRIRNAGTVPITALTTWSPGSEITFGDIPAGATTDYSVLPGGVYHYTAFTYRYEGLVREQPVTDFVGEEPMKGTQFTYEVELTETTYGPYMIIRAVTRDR